MSRPWRARCFEAALAAALCAALAAPAPAADAAGYHDGVRRGWYWYERQQAPGKETPEKEPAAPRAYPSLRGVTNRQLWDMDPDGFRALQEEKQKKAVRDPSPENIAEMMRVNDIARRKSLAYMNAMQAFLQRNPQYDMRTVYPTRRRARRA
jgi:conjugal transfer pilus assembly protein TraF